MSKRKNKTPNVIDAMIIWNMQKPRYNGFACGHGYYKDKSKYDRKEKHKTNWKDWE